jgi:hypothetical protein
MRTQLSCKCTIRARASDCTTPKLTNGRFISSIMRECWINLSLAPLLIDAASSMDKIRIMTAQFMYGTYGQTYHRPLRGGSNHGRMTVEKPGKSTGLVTSQGDRLSSWFRYARRVIGVPGHFVNQFACERLRHTGATAREYCAVRSPQRGLAVIAGARSFEIETTGVANLRCPWR